MPQILCVACFKGVFQLDGSNALLVILISDYGLLLEKIIRKDYKLVSFGIFDISLEKCGRNQITS